MDERQCPLCGSPRVARRFTKDEVGYWACAACGFQFATPAVNPNLANTIGEYEAAYVQYLEPNAADAANVEAVYAWMTSAASLDGERLLDVGAGSGKFVRELRRRGVEARGIEPSRALFDRFLAGDDAFGCTTLDAVSGTFDVITAFDVIEHVADPHAFARDLAARLAPDGVCFLSTPDVESLTARLFGRRWHFYYPYHLSYFGPSTLDRLARQHDLRIAAVSHRGRRRSIGYMVRYAAEFIARRPAPAWAARFDGWCLPVNLFDTMYVVMRRTSA